MNKETPLTFITTYARNPEKTKEIDDTCDYIGNLYRSFITSYRDLIRQLPNFASVRNDRNYRCIFSFMDHATFDIERTWIEDDFIFLGSETSYGDGSTDYGDELKIELNCVFGVTEKEAHYYMKQLAIKTFNARMESVKEFIEKQEAIYKEQVDTNQQKQLEEARKLLEQNGYKVVGDNK